VEWLIHIDADEKLHGDLEEIRRLPESVRTFWMENEEAVYSEVPTSADSCFQAAKFSKCSRGEKCVSYGNGKGGGRMAADVFFNGPHRFGSTWNTKGNDTEKKLQGVVVQHYESCDYDAFKDKFTNLAVQDVNNDIPFSYYNESIKAAKQDDEDVLRCVYEKHRTVSGDKKTDCFSR
jgi:hypothetical protein